jgi:L-ascorbate metabolism protein UlaG (beta-lactamase superfamily)
MTVRVTWYGHACFRLETGGVAVVTDPYTPETSGFAPVREPAEVVVRSSPNDGFHCNAAMILGAPELVEAVEVARLGPRIVRGIEFEAFATRESLVHKEQPLDNAIYRFSLDGVRILHMGDLGNPLEPAQLDRLRGEVDLLLALTGGPPTIELEDLDRAIAEIRPRIIVPMHFKVPQLRISALPVDTFLSRHRDEIVRRIGSPAVEIEPARLPEATEIWVLEPAC